MTTLCCGAWASHCGGFSCCKAQALGTRASVFVAHGLSSCGSWALEHRLSSFGTQALLLRSMWDLSGPGIKPVFPALAGGFLTTVPPGKPHDPGLERGVVRISRHTLQLPLTLPSSTKAWRKDYAPFPEHFRSLHLSLKLPHSPLRVNFTKSFNFLLWLSNKMNTDIWGVQRVIYWILFMCPCSMLNVFYMHHLNFMFIIALRGGNYSPFTDDENWG